MDFFDLESPFMRFLDRLFNLLWLNLIVVVCSLPVVTAGASFTAMHYVLLRMKKNEEGYVFPNFMKSFKQNFAQATKIWLVLLFFGAVCGVDIYLFANEKVAMPSYFKMIIYVLTLIVVMGILFIFPVLAHYDNVTKIIVKNAYMMAIFGNLKALIMALLVALPWVAAAFVPNFIFICLMYGFTLPGFICAYFYDDFFLKFEQAALKAKEEAAEKAAEEAAEEAEEIEEKAEEEKAE